MNERDITTCRCLYIEDERADRERMERVIKGAWRKIFPSVPFTFEPVDFAAGEVAIREQLSGYEVVVIDIFEKLPPASAQRLGLELIADASAEERVAIIAISQDSSYLNQARSSGAHAAIDKRQAYGDKSRMYTAEQLKQALAAVRLNPVPTHDWELTRVPPRDLHLDAAIAGVGESTVKDLIFQVSGTPPASARVKFVRAGLSGAAVLHCTLPAGTGKARPELLLKMSRDAGSMREELEGWSRTTDIADRLFPDKPAHDEPIESGGWYAIATGFQAGVTLTDWLVGRTESPPPEDEVVRVLRQLFLTGGLSAGYKRTAAYDDQARPAELIRTGMLGLRRRASIALAAEELGPLLRKYTGGSPFEAVEPFFESGRVGEFDAEKLSLGGWSVLSHNDLHGRNALVNEHSVAFLLDPATIAMRHWAADWARLTADLTLSGVATMPSAHEWSDLSTWRSGVELITRGADVPSASSLLPVGVAAAVDWLRGHLGEIFGEVGEGLPVEWEARLALAVELLRGTSRRQDLPSPVRALALLSAADALSAAAEAFGTRDAA